MSTELLIAHSKRGGFKVSQEGRFHDGLTLGELIEQIIAIFGPPNRPPYPMLTEEQWNARYPSVPEASEE